MTLRTAAFAIFLFASLSLFCSPAAGEHGVCPYLSEASRDLIYTMPEMKGDDVANVQQHLKALGFYKGDINSVYNLDTHRAVWSFQVTTGLTGNGILDENTWNALSKEYDNKLSRQNPPPGEVSIIIDVGRLSLTVFADGQPFKKYPVAIGKTKTPTPLGNWRIVSKASKRSPALGTRWLGLNVPWGTYGIHGTNNPGSIGQVASHGCIRMNNRHVEEIFPWVTHGTQVVIVGNPLGYLWQEPRTLQPGYSGSDVLEVQRSLRRLGFFRAGPNGLWGPETTRAVKRAMEHYHIQIQGEPKVDQELYSKLGLMPPLNES